jgi:hypothetical protein
MAAKFRRFAAGLSEADQKLFLQRAQDLEREATTSSGSHRQNGTRASLTHRRWLHLGAQFGKSLQDLVDRFGLEIEIDVDRLRLRWMIGESASPD